MDSTVRTSEVESRLAAAGEQLTVVSLHMHSLVPNVLRRPSILERSGIVAPSKDRDFLRRDSNILNSGAEAGMIREFGQEAVLVDSRALMSSCAGSKSSSC